MAATKTTTLTIELTKIERCTTFGCEAEHRSIANMIEILIRTHCEKSGITIEQFKNLE